MKAAIFDGPRSISIGERPDPIINEPTDAIVRDQVDAAYRAKYGGHYASIDDSITVEEHRASTLLLLPGEENR